MNRTLSVLLLALFAISASAFLVVPDVDLEEMKSLWSSWKAINNKVYAADEEDSKFNVFIKNYFTVQRQNEQNPEAKFALNQFADLSAEEFKAQYLTGLRVNQEALEAKQTESTVDYSILDLPESVDWRTKNILSKVKNQGSCGSCWAFSAVGAIEALHAIKTGNVVAFSEQQVVSCDKVDGGCQGGEMQPAFEYTAANGLETEADYPYKAHNGECNFEATKAQKVNTGYKNVTANNVDALKAAIAVQPIAVAVDATILQFYFGGVVRYLCGKNLNHGILAVGYGNIKGKDAFIIKNSWGAGWGDKGFGYISADPKANGGAGVCGILMDNSFPTLD